MMKILTQETACSSQDLNWAPPEYKSVVLLLQPICLAGYNTNERKLEVHTKLPILAMVALRKQNYFNTDKV
jgi:hypothetical protein